MQHIDDPSFTSIEDDVDFEGYIFEGYTDPTIPLVELETLLNRPLSWRKRRIQIGILLAALLVTLLTFWNVLTPRQLARTGAAIPGVLSITSNVTYGTVTINGRQKTVPLPVQMTLRGSARLTITLDAPPFRPITCSVPPGHQTPPGAFNPCVLRGYSPPNNRPVAVLTILFSLDGLPLAMQQQAIALLSRAATFQEATTTPGPSHVPTSIASDGTITSQLTTEPLQASASIASIPLTTLQGDPFCDERLCYAAFSASANRDHLWLVSVPMALRWQFTSAPGKVWSSVSYPVMGGWQVYLTYAPATGWQAPSVLNAGSSAARQFSSLSCATGAALLQAQVAGGEWTIKVAHDAGIQGCNLVSQQGHKDQDAFVWRFGVLLAADAQAQNVLPALPLALPEERAAVDG